MKATFAVEPGQFGTPDSVVMREVKPQLLVTTLKLEKDVHACPAKNQQLAWYAEILKAN